MTRRSEQLNRIEATLGRIETAVTGHANHLRTEVAAIRVDLKNVQSTADATRAGTMALASIASGILTDDPTEPHTPGKETK